MVVGREEQQAKVEWAHCCMILPPNPKGRREERRLRRCRPRRIYSQDHCQRGGAKIECAKERRQRDEMRW